MSRGASANLEFLTLDALAWLRELSARFEYTDTDWGEIDEFRHGADLFAATVEGLEQGRPVPRKALLACAELLIGLAAGEDGGLARAFLLPVGLRPQFTDGRPPALETAVVCAMHRLAILSLYEDHQDADAERKDEEASPDLDSDLMETSAAFASLAEEMANAGQPRDAATAMRVGANFVVATEGREAAQLVEMHRHGLPWAREAGDAEGAALHLAGVAYGLAQQAETSTSQVTQGAVLRAVCEALRHAADVQSQRREFSNMLRRAVLTLPDDKSLKAALMLLSTKARDDDASSVALFRRALHFTQPVWDLDEAELRETVPVVGELAMDLETLKYRLELSSDQHQLEANWTTLMFEHPSYRRTIPHGRTLYREGHLDRILLEMSHEITHVVTQVSMLGAAITALRAVAVDLEAILWAHVDPDRHIESENSLIAPLEDHTILALAQAEQALEVVRKMHILQRVWTPWLEGVAAFCELAVDPSAGDRASTVGEVLANLVDRRTDLSSEDQMAKLVEQRTDLERMYSLVLQQSGRQRLRTYLGGYWRKYGPGYVAVRRVVSAWRSAVGRPLPGEEVAMLLLHVTRHGTLEAMPNLALPSARFEAEARELMATWVKDLAQITGPHLEEALGPRFSGWHGKPLRLHYLEDNEAQNQAAEELSDRLIDQAWNSLRGNFADPNRVPSCDDDTAALMTVIANALTNAKQQPDFQVSMVERVIRLGCLLPLGRTASPFWVNPRTSQLVYVVRTTEADVDHGGPGYDLAAVPLPTASISALLREMQSRPDDLMTLTRLTDLASEGMLGEGRFPGQNYLAFSLGEWLHVERRGLMSWSPVSQDLVDDVRLRVLATELNSYEAEVADGEAGGLRTAAWIEGATNGWHVHADTWYEGPWSKHVKHLADLVAQRSDSVEMEERAASSLIGAEIVRGGLRSLVDTSADFERVVDLLFRSGFSPADSEWLDGLSSDEPVLSLFYKDEEGWEVRSDFAAPQPTEEHS